MSDKRAKTALVLIVILLSLTALLCSCNSGSNICYYGYFEDSAYAFVYVPRTNGFYCIKLPLEQILLWGKESGLDSIPIAMRNYVGLKDSGFIVSVSQTMQASKDLLDALGSGSDEPASNEKRVATLVEKASVLSKKPLSDKINQLCGQDALGLLELLERKKPNSWCYDAHSFFNTDDLNFSQRYFSQWLEQVLGGNE